MMPFGPDDWLPMLADDVEPAIGTTWYCGAREPLAVLSIAGQQVVLPLSDTQRCAHSQALAAMILRNLGHKPAGLDDSAAVLHQHCMSLTRHNPAAKPDRPKRPRHRTHY